VAVCAAPIKGTHMRVVGLDTCGVPITGAAAHNYTSKAFVQVTMEPQYEDGEEFLQRTADGSICVNEKDPPLFKRHQLTIDICTVDPEMTAFMLSSRTLSVGSPLVTGAGFTQKEGTPTNKWSLEIWQRVAGSGACDASGLQRYVYNAWPHAGNTRLGSYTIQNGVSQLQLIAETFAPALQWADGPGAGTSWLSPAGVLTGEHWLWAVTLVAPPTEFCGRQSI